MRAIDPPTRIFKMTRREIIPTTPVKDPAVKPETIAPNPLVTRVMRASRIMKDAKKPNTMIEGFRKTCRT